MEIITAALFKALGLCTIWEVRILLGFAVIIVTIRTGWSSARSTVVSGGAICFGQRKGVIIIALFALLIIPLVIFGH